MSRIPMKRLRIRHQAKLTDRRPSSLIQTGTRHVRDAVTSGGDEQIGRLGFQVAKAHLQQRYKYRRDLIKDIKFHDREMTRLEKKWVRKKLDMSWREYKRKKRANKLEAEEYAPPEAFSNPRMRPLRRKRKAVARFTWRAIKAEGQQDPEQLMTAATKRINYRLATPARRAARRTVRITKDTISRAARWSGRQALRGVIRTGRVALAALSTVVGTIASGLPLIGVALGIVMALCTILPGFITGVGAEQERRVAQVVVCEASDTAPPVVTAAEMDAVFNYGPPQGTVQELTVQQRAVAAAIVEVGVEEAMPPRAWVVAVMTAMQESTLGANTAAFEANSDGDVGVFQQRAKVGWYADGSTLEANVEILNDVRYAARTFYLGHDVTRDGVNGEPAAGPIGYHIPGLIDVPGWETLDLGTAAQEVQRSAYPTAYSEHEATVAALLPTLSLECTETAPVAGDNGLEGVDDYAVWYDSLSPQVKAQRWDPLGFAWRQCTSYSAFAVAKYTSYSDFRNFWRGTQFGNANTWDDAASEVGIRVDQTPAVGAVAQRESGTWGHVAFIVAVNPDGTFVINEYNHVTPLTFSSRTTRIGEGSENFTNILHFEESS